MRVTVTSKGQVTLPIEARRRLGIKTGTKLEVFIKDDNTLQIIPVMGSISELKGFLPKPERTVTLEEMDEAIRQGALDSMR